MLYFLLDKREECIQKLNEHYDAVGCNYSCKTYPFIPPHFSGNFWWARSDYLTNLDKLDESLNVRQSAEFWLFRKAPLFYSIYNSMIDHYRTIYPKNMYIQNDINNTNDTNLGFIILRNVTSKESNKYWIECYNCIRDFYPNNEIVIIDVTSNKTFVIEKNLIKTTIVNSEYSGHYDIIPYLYYLENRYFKQAVIIKDTMFFTKHFDFKQENSFLWQFEHNWDDDKTEIELITKLDNFQPLLQTYLNKSLWKGCFQSMSFISHDCLKQINLKYNLLNLHKFIKDNHTNSCFGRIFAVMLTIENGENKKSICGDFHYTHTFNTNYDNFMLNKVNNIYWLSPIIHVAT